MEELQNVEEVKPVIFNDLAAAFNLSFEQFGKLNYIETKKVQKLINHPVHIIDEKNNLSPSAMIPFCEFEGNMSIMGTRIKKFDVPVCSSFQAKILNDQLCYEVDPNRYKMYLNPNEIRQGLKLYIDTNNDRQTTSEDSDFMIYLDTLGK